MREISHRLLERRRKESWDVKDVEMR